MIKARDAQLAQLAVSRQALPNESGRIGAEAGMTAAEDAIRASAETRIDQLREAQAKGTAPPPREHALSFGDQPCRTISTSTRSACATTAWPGLGDVSWPPGGSCGAERNPLRQRSVRACNHAARCALGTTSNSRRSPARASGGVPWASRSSASISPALDSRSSRSSAVRSPAST